MHNLLSVIYLLITILYKESLADEACGDWETFKDEKCFKIIDDTLVNYNEALNTCAHQDISGSLAILESKEEQEFLTNFVFNTKKVADNVWLGIQNTSTKFTAIDNSELSYANWSPGSPQNETDYNCVQMIADKALVGKWINEPCARKNAFVCQKMQIWSVARLQKTLLDERKSLYNKILILQQINSDMQQKQTDMQQKQTDMQQKQTDMQQKQTVMQLKQTDIQQKQNDMQQKQNLMDDTITALKQNPVPLGFIYVQLPGQIEPKLVWPQLNWADVSSSYAGLFFRVLGGNSEVFETEQKENDRYLEAVRVAEEHTNGWSLQINTPVNGEWSSNLLYGGSSRTTI